MSDKPNGQPLDPCLLVIFGGTGDLTKRLLLPSILNLALSGVLPDNFQLLGVAQEDWSDDRFRQHIGDSLQEFWGPDVDPKTKDWLCSRAHYESLDFGDASRFQDLKTRIEALEKEHSLSGNRVYYLAVAPRFVAGISADLAAAGLVAEGDHSWRRLVVEKPFGHDLASASALNAELQQNLQEQQIFRVDHFAGKDAVQDLVVFRFANSFVEPLWHRSLISSVEITASETVGVEGRAGYYESAGALRDMVPNHLAELLSLIAMEPPVSLSAQHLRDKQVEVLDSVRRHTAEEVSRYAVRGQYTAGSIDGKEVPGYRAEPGVKPDSSVETYVAFRVDIDNWRWAGVPFYLRTGKRLSTAKTQIVVRFRQPPARLFADSNVDDRAQNCMVFNLQPDPSISLGIRARAPGIATVVEQGEMSFQFPDGPFGRHAKGYERLLHDVIAGDQTLFQKSAFVEGGWSLVQPMLNAWSASAADLQTYAAGSSGPKAADDLLAADGNAWSSLGSV